LDLKVYGIAQYLSLGGTHGLNVRSKCFQNGINVTPVSTLFAGLFLFGNLLPLAQRKSTLNTIVCDTVLEVLGAMLGLS